MTEQPDDTATPRLAETFEEAEDALLSRWPETRLEPSLDRITAFLDVLGNPQSAYPVIHLTGTNGKTSTSRMVDTLLRALELRTGRFTSPHVEKMSERISVDGEPLTDEEFVAAFNDVAPYTHLVDAESDHPLSFFETIVGMAYAKFAEAPVDVAVVEVGMGGSWDATNVADGVVAVVLPVAVDHTRYLGSTPADIAVEKAGIIKPGAVAVLAQQQPDVAEIMLARAAEVGATVAREGLEFGVVSRVAAVGGQVVSLQGLRGRYDELFLPLYGAHQAENAAVALAAVEAFVGGMLSTLLATPCSAPLVGTVVGFALARSPFEITAVLLALGVGMALPFLTLALAPSLATRLPRPGQWMIQLRRIMGLLLLTTAIWLIASLWNIAGMAVASLVSIVLNTMLAVRAAVTRWASLRTARWSGAATALLACCAVAISSLTSPGAGARSAPPTEWQAFDPNAISTLVASGKTVLVDVTASWCLTCKVNELSVLDTAAVRTRLKQDNIVRMRADWSRYNPGVLAYIQGFGRFGIPLDVVYGPRMPQGQLLPEILQTSTLFHALDNATPAKTAKSNSSAD